MLIDYVLEGGQLMLVLAVIFFAVLFLAIYAAFLLLAELKRAQRFRKKTLKRSGWVLGELHVTAFRDASLPARYIASAIREGDIIGAEPRLAQRRRDRAAEIEDSIVQELLWPVELLEFLGGYAAKIGLCGTILGLCMHFLTFGTDGNAQIASRAMAVALYTTLGALTIALVAEPTAYALGWVERRIRKDLKEWFRFLESILMRQGCTKKSVPPAAAPTRKESYDQATNDPSEGSVSGEHARPHLDPPLLLPDDLDGTNDDERGEGAHSTSAVLRRGEAD